MSPEKELLFSCYVLTKGNPIEDAKALFRQVEKWSTIKTSATCAHRLRQGPAQGHSRRRLSSRRDGGACVRRASLLPRCRLHLRCRRSRREDHDPANGDGRRLPPQLAMLVGQRGFPARCRGALRYAAVRYGGRRRFGAGDAAAVDGCGVFLQSDIVNQQRKGWPAEEIMASLCAVLPLNVWVYAGRLNNLAAGGQEIRSAGRHAPQPRGGEDAGRFHTQQSS